MQDYLTTSFHRHISAHSGDAIEDIGLELICAFEGIQLFMCFVIASTDYDMIPEFLPEERFMTGSVHVGELHELSDVADEIQTILDNANAGDTLVFFCSSADILADALDALAYNEQ
ncbi:hypothetical protein AAEX37_01833 [Oligella sp. MSHR50489EDL]|uniref:hypothetical protein n=1 Tax=Oligella sp. MSHR50489EDL TaxID=3139409 RepID=UPI003D81A365